MLLKAIDENWDKPHSIVDRERAEKSRQRQKQVDRQQLEEERKISATKKSRANRKRQLLDEWAQLSADCRMSLIQKAADRQTSKMISDLIRRELPKATNPRVQVLDVLAEERGLPPVTQPKQE